MSRPLMRPLPLDPRSSGESTERKEPSALPVGEKGETRASSSTAWMSQISACWIRLKEGGVEPARAAAGHEEEMAVRVGGQGRRPSHFSAGAQGVLRPWQLLQLSLQVLRPYDGPQD
jgi:hypothetical protein